MKTLQIRPIISGIFCVILLSCTPGAQARDSVTIFDSSGKPMFQLNYLDAGDSLLDDGDPDAEVLWYVSPSHEVIRNGIHSGGKAWADILGPYSVNTFPGTVNVGGNDENNDSALGGTIHQPPFSDYTLLGAVAAQGYDGLADPRVQADGWTAHALMIVGTWPAYGGVGFYTDAPMALLMDNGDKMPISQVFFHEFGHALGIFAGVETVEYTANNGDIFNAGVFDSSLNAYTSHLVDSRGVSVKPGMLTLRSTADALKVLADGAIDSLDEVFITDDNKLYFVGDNVSDVLQGAYGNKMAVNGWESDTAEFSHLELRGSLMSHQAYRNFGGFYEADLAVMQDIGFTLDRKNFFGLSVYGDDQTIVNTQGFYARNDSGTAYRHGVYNQTANTVGLHVHGSRNTVVQQADILASGYGSNGIRLDGMANHLVVAPGSRIETLGEKAVGLAVSYGSDTTIAQMGTIRATGVGGRAVAFDFGSNLLSDLIAYHGSYIAKSADVDTANNNAITWKEVERQDAYRFGYADMLDAPLVGTFDLSGTLEGQDAAIHISAGAHVRRINILAGASIAGDIVSHWNPDLGSGKNALNANLIPQNADFSMFITDLTFGHARDENGNALSGADKNFRMSYSGDISGGGSVAMSVVGGILEYNGAATVISLHNRAGARLAGGGSYTIADTSGTISGRNTYANTFVNDGVFDIGTRNRANGASVALENGAAFVNNGTITVDYDKHGNNDILTITGVAGTSAQFSGVTEYRALPDYYASGERISVNEALSIDANVTFGGQNTLAAGSFTPTLDFVMNTAGGKAEVTAVRHADAYSQFANDSGSRAVGRELRRISYLSNMPKDFETVLAGLDMAGGAAGVERGLNELLPHFATSAATRSLDNQRVLGSALLNRLLPRPAAFGRDPCGGGEAEEVRIFATGVGGGGRQSGKRYGVRGSHFWSAGALAGVERERNGVIGGVHLGMNHWKQKGSGGAADRFRTNAFSFGVHGSAARADWNGGYVFAQLRGTIEDNRLERDVRLVTGRSVNRSKWTGYSGNAVIGGGFDFEAEEVKFGPLAGLDYASTHRRGVNERGDFGRLDIESETYRSFRVMAGMRVSGRVGVETTVSGTVQWNHELLGKMGTTRARFSGVGMETFGLRSRYAGRDSVSGTLGLTQALNSRMRLSFEVGGEFFRRGYVSGWGSATFGVDF